MLLGRLGRGIAGFSKATTREVRAVAAFFAFVIGVAAIVVMSTAYSDYRSNYKFNHLSSAEHLAEAKTACGAVLLRGSCLRPDEAEPHLGKIPASAPEYSEASNLLASIKQQEYRDFREANERSAQSRSDSEVQSREQMYRNVQGSAHDNFTCATSTNGQPIMSFDAGRYWWNDDGRCAAREEKKREAHQREVDDEAQLFSYWPTTIRVDTDMDSFWLEKEERTCQTYPDAKGRIAVVACNAAGSHRDHNIPVKFWGGVDRDTISDWKCQREGSEFACRAID